MTAQAGVRARFAPAPTGFLHVGSARTALFNWLYARHTGGTFVLRIEDTDLERSQEDWVEGIQTTMRWLGLDWDEGPYRQTDRVARYLELAEQLRAAGKAYDCFCTEEDVKGRGGPPGYDGHCRHLTDAERQAQTEAGKPRSLRFRTPDEGVSSFTDLIRGEVTVDWSTINDFVIVRSSGAPVFFLANAADDADMGITHVIRGEDLLDSTHRVLALRDALGFPGRPVFAHLPLIVGADRAKLSKRHGAIALEDFAKRGYLPEALFNYLGLLGFSAPDGREVMTAKELAGLFDIERVSQSPAFFDYEKLNWINGEYIRALSLDELVARARPYAVELYQDRLDDAVFAAAMALAQVRAVTLLDAAEAPGFLFVDEDAFAIDEESLEKLRQDEVAGPVLAAAASHLETVTDWTVETVDLRPVLEGLGIKPRKGLPAVYAAIEGRHAGLPLFDSIALLGRERSLRRLRAAVGLLS